MKERKKEKKKKLLFENMLSNETLFKTTNTKHSSKNKTPLFRKLS